MELSVLWRHLSVGPVSEQVCTTDDRRGGVLPHMLPLPAKGRLPHELSVSKANGTNPFVALPIDADNTDLAGADFLLTLTNELPEDEKQEEKRRLKTPSRVETI